MAAFRSDVFLIKLDPGGIVPEAEFAGTNTTKRVRVVWCCGHERCATSAAYAPR